MNPAAAFPIMMGSCAFLMPIASVRFVKTGTYHVQAALGLALGGLPAALIAALIVKSLPLGAVRAFEARACGVRGLPGGLVLFNPHSVGWFTSS